MDVRRLTGSLGAEVSGISLETISDDEFELLDKALLDHQVVFLRDQHISADAQITLAHRFGTPDVFPLRKHFGGTEILSHIEDTATSPPDADNWHTDITWIAAPPKIAILAALDIPAYGGDTLWADLYGAYDALSPTMRAIAGTLRIKHTQGEAFWAAFGRHVPAEQVAALREVFPGAEHPLVRTHPVTGGKALFVAGGFMESIVGMSAEESRALIEHFQRQIENPNLQVRWNWRAGDVAIWDERCTNHRALGDHFPQYRRMRRCTIEGDIPV